MSYRMGKAWDKVALFVSQAQYKCMVCGRDIFDDNLGLCNDCLSRCVFNDGKTCLRCGSAIAGDEHFCGSCNFEKVYFDKAYSAFVYDGEIVKVIHSIKFGKVEIFCRMLAVYLTFLVKKYKIEFDAVCYVPMTKKSQRQRSFNQARVLAEYLCDMLQQQCLLHALKKIRQTEQQEKLSRAQRYENVKKAFTLCEGVELKGKTVLLVDDVKTTTATLNECARVLKKGGADRVVCLTVASRRQSVLFEKGEQNVTNNKKTAERTSKGVLKGS